MKTAEEIELELIARDCSDLIRIINQLNGCQSSVAVALGISPIFALVAEESFGYLAAPPRRGLAGGVPGPLFERFSASVTKLRTRVKLFDDTEGGLEGLMDTLALAHRKSSDWFLQPHQGFLGRLLRRLQPDLGIFWFEEKPIVATHSALVTLGLTHEQILALDVSNMGEELGRFTNQFAVAMGEYIGELAAVLNIYGFTTDLNMTPEEPLQIPLTHTDYYGQKVYASISDKLDISRKELSVAILFLVTQINFVEDVLTRMLDPASNLLLRARFLTAYHATRALKKLEAVEAVGGDNRLVATARELLDQPESIFFLKARQLRNLMAHYELRGAARFVTKQGQPLDDISQALCGLGAVEVAATAHKQLQRITEAFMGAVSKDSLKES